MAKRLGKQCPSCGGAMKVKVYMTATLPAGRYEAGEVVDIAPVPTEFWVCPWCGRRKRVRK
jgi:hypothetical protein